MSFESCSPVSPANECFKSIGCVVHVLFRILHSAKHFVIILLDQRDCLSMDVNWIVCSNLCCLPSVTAWFTRVRYAGNIDHVVSIFGYHVCWWRTEEVCECNNDIYNCNTISTQCRWPVWEIQGF